MKRRKKTLQLNIGSLKVGGNAPISVQSMTNTDTKDIKATIEQIQRLEEAGCELVRVAVPDEKAANCLKRIIDHANIPVIADIHFNYRLALQSIEAGVHGIRINPGNIGGRKRLEAVVRKAKEKGIAIRVGINSGSLEKDILKKYGHPTAEALVESALRNIAFLEEMSFHSMKISIKSSDIRTTVEAYRLISRKTKYPLHIGITEAGTAFSGTIRSAIGLGIILEDGIGDTMRVSLSADPVEEVRVGFEILKCLGIRKKGPELISCPTCGRKQIDVITIAKEVEEKLCRFLLPIKIAVMGCEVNGPGEAKEADIGIAGSKNVGVIFKKGKIIKKCPKRLLVEEFIKEISSFGEA
jgi:(E)-4-hydroxy-3-methylbut-2-enyl-diphosphate synthase